MSEIKEEVPEQISIEVKDLQKNYLVGDVVVPALRGVNLKVKKGEFVAIMGPSGSGKSTLLNLIGKLDSPTGGTIYVNGDDVSKKAATSYHRWDVGFVFQSLNLIPTLTAKENIELPMMVAGVAKKNREARVTQLLEMVGLTERANHRPAELSGGEQQRVTIARALANGPSIILADEPTGNLDSRTGAKVMDILQNLSKNEGKTLIIITHDQGIANRSQRILILVDGEIVTESKKEAEISFVFGRYS
jgi:putative ABC transport system ATP-binding protein